MTALHAALTRIADEIYAEHRSMCLMRHFGRSCVECDRLESAALDAAELWQRESAS